MSDTTCPSCNAAASPGARACERCGYRFLEGGPAPAGGPNIARVLGGAVAVAGVVILGVLLLGGGEGEQRDAPVAALDTSRRLEVLSAKPLATRAVERRLEARFTAMRDDDSAAVSCSEREPRPAHSIRRCTVRYPSGIERIVVLLTNSRGNEVLSEP